MFICALECVSAPLYSFRSFSLSVSLSSGYISCGETFRNTPQNDDVTSNNNNNNYNNKRIEKKNTLHIKIHLTIWRSVCIIFVFHIFFHIFFWVFLFPFIYFVAFNVMSDDGGKEDEMYWSNTALNTLMISSLSYAYSKLRSVCAIKMYINIFPTIENVHVQHW